MLIDVSPQGFPASTIYNTLENIVILSSRLTLTIIASKYHHLIFESHSSINQRILDLFSVIVSVSAG